MRVTIKHREERAGAIGTKRNYFVDCNIQFSNEEQAILKARSLYDHTLDVGPAEPPKSNVPAIIGIFMPIIGVIMIFVGIIVAIVISFSTSNGSLGSLLIWGGIIIAGLGYFLSRTKPPPRQQITIKEIMSHGGFTIYTTSPAHAKLADGEIREKLKLLKALIGESATVAKEDTFEL